MNFISALGSVERRDHAPCRERVPAVGVGREAGQIAHPAGARGRLRQVLLRPEEVHVSVRVAVDSHSRAAEGKATSRAHSLCAAGEK